MNGCTETPEELADRMNDILIKKRLRADVVQRCFSVSVIYIIHLSGRVFIVYLLTKTLLYSRIIETTI